MSEKPRKKPKKRKRLDFRQERAASDRRERIAAAGATLLILGLGAVGIGDSPIGAAAGLAGMVVLMYAVHTYGRLGEEA